jgi:hypothetical protein
MDASWEWKTRARVPNGGFRPRPAEAAAAAAAAAVAATAAAATAAAEAAAAAAEAAAQEMAVAAVSFGASACFEGSSLSIILPRMKRASSPSVTPKLVHSCEHSNGSTS